jgi:predicted DNA-binding transcriptional regulator AlpA
MSGENVLMTLTEVREMLRIKQSSFYQFLKKEDSFPKPILVGSKRRWKREDIVEWIHSRAYSA